MLRDATIIAWVHQTTKKYVLQVDSHLPILIRISTKREYVNTMEKSYSSHEERISYHFIAYVEDD